MSDNDDSVAANDPAANDPAAEDPAATTGARVVEHTAEAGERPGTEEQSQVDELDRIARLPLSEQPAEYERIHHNLQRALAAVDEA